MSAQRCIAALAIVLAVATSGCGGPHGRASTIGVAAPPPPAEDDWPARSTSPSDAVTVGTALASADGAVIRVRAYLVAVTLPCPLCNVGGRTAPREDVTGRTSRARGPSPPGCLPCPEPAATISDEAPGASAVGAPHAAPLRAVAVAAGLQPRHVGQVFLLTGVFHANGATGPELEATDVRALDAPPAAP